MGSAEVRERCPVDEAGAGLLRAATPALRAGARVQHLHMPALGDGPGRARAYHRTQSVKLARTIAGLAGSETIEAPHLAEAIQYRPRRQA